MKALKNFEALFIIVLTLACAANFAFEREVAQPEQPPVPAVAALPAENAMPVVVVSAKRMSAAEKRAAIAAENKAGAGGI